MHSFPSEDFEVLLNRVPVLAFVLPIYPNLAASFLVSQAVYQQPLLWSKIETNMFQNALIYAHVTHHYHALQNSKSSLRQLINLNFQEMHNKIDLR